MVNNMCFKPFLNFVFLLLFWSCSHLTSSNEFAAVDDASLVLFRPHVDFPVLEGDRFDSSTKTWSLRAIASNKEISNDRSRNSYEENLDELESVQSDYDLKLYNQFKNQLGTFSEKEYFLELSTQDKEAYLISRGLLPSRREDTQRLGPDLFHLRRNQVGQGMNKDQVIDSLGQPIRIEIAGNPRNQNERWFYQLNGAPRYIYFEAGAVQGWE